MQEGNKQNSDFTAALAGKASIEQLNGIMVSDLHNFLRANALCIVKWDGNTLNTPYKAGSTVSTMGFAFVYALGTDYANIMAMATGDDRIFTQTLSAGSWFEWKAK